MAFRAACIAKIKICLSDQPLSGCKDSTTIVYINRGRNFFIPALHTSYRTVRDTAWWGMMRFTQFVSLCALATEALTLTTDSGFEPSNFNVTAALIANGVDPDFIPDAQALSRRSSLGACKVAVC
jgi:hypothetical protein